MIIKLLKFIAQIQYITFCTLICLCNTCLGQKSDQSISVGRHSDNADKREILFSWLSDLVKSNISLDSQTIVKSKIKTFKNYSNNAIDTFKKQIDYDLKQKEYKIISTEDVITFNYTKNNDDDVYFFVLQNKFIYSYHKNMGNDGHSLIYDLVNRKFTYFHYISCINKNVANIQREGYDFKMGRHYVQEGKWHMNTNLIKWKRKEY